MFRKYLKSYVIMNHTNSDMIIVFDYIWYDAMKNKILGQAYFDEITWTIQHVLDYLKNDTGFTFSKTFLSKTELE